LLIGDIPGIYAYIDNVLIATKLEEGHAKLVKKVLSILHNAGLMISPAKCNNAQTELEFVGYTVSAAGITPIF
jgi:hypothetical protein